MLKKKKKKNSKLNFFPRLGMHYCSPNLGEDRVWAWRRTNGKHKYHVRDTVLDATFMVSYFPFNSFWILKEKTITTTYEGTTLEKWLPTGLYKANLRGQQDNQCDLQFWDPEDEGKKRLTLGRFSVRPSCHTLPLHTLTVHVWSYAALKSLLVYSHLVSLHKIMLSSCITTPTELVRTW